MHFYERDEDLVARVAQHVAGALAKGAHVIVLATDAHARAFERRLRETGTDIDAAIAGGIYESLDADDLLQQLAPGGSPDPQAFDRIVGRRVRAAASTGVPPAVYGELVALLWDGGRVNAAMQLESLWNELGAAVPFSLLCAYRAPQDAGDGRVEQLSQICNLHTGVVGDDPRGTSIRSFEATNDAPRAARRFLAERLRELGSEDLVLDATLVVTELAANAVLHARTAFSVAIMPARGALRIEVRDGSALPPVMRETGSSSASGRGLPLIDALAREWGVDHTASGKTVWAHLAAPAPA